MHPGDHCFLSNPTMFSRVDGARLLEFVAACDGIQIWASYLILCNDERFCLVALDILKPSIMIRNLTRQENQNRMEMCPRTSCP